MEPKLELNQSVPGMMSGIETMENEPSERPDAPPRKLSRVDEARRVVEEYAADLREIIKKLTRKMH
ncbi:hypothetical protein [Bradyrhizobium sp. 23AC]